MRGGFQKSSNSSSWVGWGCLGRALVHDGTPPPCFLGCKEDAQPACPLLERLGLLAVQGRVTAGTPVGTRGDASRAWRQQEPGGSGGTQGCWGAAVSEIGGPGGVSCPVGPTSAHPEEPSPLPVVTARAGIWGPWCELLEMLVPPSGISTLCLSFLSLNWSQTPKMGGCWL